MADGSNEQLITQTAHEVFLNAQFWVAIVGVIGGMVGATAAVAGQVFRDWLNERWRRRRDEPRRALLRRMLDDENFRDKWRDIATLARVVGADEEATKQLLLEIGARGSETDDGLWGLCKYHPLVAPEPSERP